MLKQLKTILMAIMILIAIPISVYSDTQTNDSTSLETEVEVEDQIEVEDQTEVETEVEIETETETNILASTSDMVVLKDINGAKVRVMQLKNRINHQIEDGDLIINYLNENSEEDTSELSEIIEELKTILSEIESYDPQGKTADELAEAYTSYKASAIELSNSFKKIAGEILTQEDRENLKEIIEERKNQRKEIRDETIENLKYEYNRNKAKEIALRLGFNESMDGFEFGEGKFDQKEFREKILGEFRGLNESQKEKLVINLREENQRFRIEARAKEEDMRLKYEQRIKELEMRLNEREERFEMRFKNSTSGQEMRMRTEGDKFEVRTKNPNGEEFRAKIDERKTEIKDGDFKFKQETTQRGRLKIEFQDNADHALKELNRIIDIRLHEISNMQANGASEDEIAILEKQVEKLKQVVSKIEENRSSFKKAKIEESDDGSLEVEVETENEESEEEYKVEDDDSQEESETETDEERKIE